MEDRFCRTERLIGRDKLEKLKNASVAVFGLGGVGSYAAEALVRSGIGKISVIDKDVVSISNINRQLIALDSTVGRYKADVSRERILSINPNVDVKAYKLFYLPDNADEIDISQFDYIVDAVDNVTAKIELALRAERFGVKIISCMGTGNKIDPSMLEVSDIYDTSVCPLAKVMRRELKKRGVKALKVVYSKEKPITPDSDDKRTPASVAFVPGVAGLLLAGEVIRDIISY